MRTLVFVHGYMDAAGTFDLVAPLVASAGYRILAPDLRGFGDGARVPRGAVYHFADYVFDLADMLDVLVPGEQVVLVGHSMGGTIATMYAGTFPERVDKLVVCEGLGPPSSTPDEAPFRMRRWIEDVRKVRASGGPRIVGTYEDAVRRVVQNHSKVDVAVARSRTRHLVRTVENTKEDQIPADAPVLWAFDPLHKTIAPTPFFSEVFRAFARQVRCKTLLVFGGSDGFRLEGAEEEARSLAFESSRKVDLPGAGHMMHWTKPELLAEEISRFLEE